jgi:hypothetical protein
MIPAPVSRRTIWAAEHEGAAQRGVPRERHLDARCEDANPGVTAALRREHEHALGQVHLAREQLHRLGVEAAGVGEHCQRVAGERLVGEDVAQHVLQHSHAGRLPRQAADVHRDAYSSSKPYTKASASTFTPAGEAICST